MRKAVILLSGGLDSATCLALAKAEAFDCVAMSFSYGQHATPELTAAAKLCQHYEVPHKVVDLDTQLFQGSALTDKKLEMLETSHEAIPVTYVPARNTLFLATALAFAESIGARDIFIGANVVDYSGYPDCRPEYITAFEQMANLATKAGVEGDHFTIQAPLMYLSKAKIIQTGIELSLDYSMTVSCYQPDSDGHPCQQCESCLLRAEGFAEIGMADPVIRS